MECRITCDGVPIGQAMIEPFSGIAHAVLEPSPAYDGIRFHAIEAGRRLRQARGWSHIDGDFAEQFAREWSGGRLAICDDELDELAVASVVVLDWAPETAPSRAHVVVDLRPDMARIEAFLITIGRDDGGRSRPAA